MPFAKRSRTLPAPPASPLKTAAWSTPLPHGHVRIAISRGPLPPRVDLNTMRYSALVPGHSQRGLEPGLFQKLYVNRLATLDAEHVFADIQRMAGGRIPVLCCYESARHIFAGRCGCHRHLAAAWFEKALDIRCEEIGAHGDRFKYWTMHPMPVSVPGERPRTLGHAPQLTKAAAATKRLGQGKFNF